MTTCQRFKWKHGVYIRIDQCWVDGSLMTTTIKPKGGSERVRVKKLRTGFLLHKNFHGQAELAVYGFQWNTGIWAISSFEASLCFNFVQFWNLRNHLYYGFWKIDFEKGELKGIIKYQAQYFRCDKHFHIYESLRMFYLCVFKPFSAVWEHFQTCSICKFSCKWKFLWKSRPFYTKSGHATYLFPK